MAETERITVAETSEGPGGRGEVGTEVSLPVVEILTGRGFVTGKSGSGKSNSASVIAEKLLDGGFGLLIVDIDGEYYGLKEEYEILHVGGDEECDIQVTTDHSERLASLALDQNVPIILDMSSYLDEKEAEALLTAVARSLFAKAKKRKQPFLLLVEEVHEYIPEKGSVGECGKMLIKIGKRGRKHGLGICGISQRPADVKKDFITQCDWLLWHRLTWNNDTKVVRRILDGEYADAVESLDDGEGFLMTDWAETVKRVQFHRKRTFDAGATPGLDDFERPDLKSVSDDLVSELQEITEDQQARESQITELREELDRKNSTIAELETELQDARDLSRMAEQFVGALVQHVEGPAPGRTERERMRSENALDAASAALPPDGVPTPSPDGEATGSKPDGDDVAATFDAYTADGDDGEASVVDPLAARADEPPGVGTVADVEATADGGVTLDGAGTDGWAATDSETSDDGASEAEVFSAMMDAAGDDEEDHATADGTTESDEQEGFGMDDGWGDLGVDDGEVAFGDDDGATEESDWEVFDADDGGTERDDEFSADEILATLNEVTEREVDDRRRQPTAREEVEATLRSDAEIVTGGSDASTAAVAASGPDEQPLVVRELKADIAAMETKTRKMLSFYREFGPGTPLNAHFAAGGDGDRKLAYAHNRTLRVAGLIEHVGRGHYDYRLRELLEEELSGHVTDEELDTYVAEIESTALDG